MSVIFNPVVLSVIVLCVLCLCKLNVMFSLVIACTVGGLTAGLDLMDTIVPTMLGGFSNNAEAAMAYILLGTFASCLAYTGVTDILSKKIAQTV